MILYSVTKLHPNRTVVTHEFMDIISKTFDCTKTLMKITNNRYYAVNQSLISSMIDLLPNRGLIFGHIPRF